MPGLRLLRYLGLGAVSLVTISINLPRVLRDVDWSSWMPWCEAIQNRVSFQDNILIVGPGFVLLVPLDSTITTTRDKGE